MDPFNPFQEEVGGGGAIQSTFADMALQHKLTLLVDNSSLCSWTYAIFWQLSSADGQMILGWEDGYFSTTNEKSTQRNEAKQFDADQILRRKVRLVRAPRPVPSRGGLSRGGPCHRPGVVLSPLQVVEFRLR
ncbi:hypothetical protein SELMODRAFT_445428 [Selaginella moellendorffii]|uniref:Transcription factor MYC/MYB N-terminal domain-containing protein n=1 Tax=Selaginella moellendorffii TaxID=88036 RepID=D8SIK1_SELML|nr:hypothetical protein SELMODRAFT_445428 [Selaginella moellendorffii]